VLKGCFVRFEDVIQTSEYPHQKGLQVLRLSLLELPFCKTFRLLQHPLSPFEHVVVVLDKLQKLPFFRKHVDSERPLFR